MGSDGYIPQAGLVSDSSGNLYGTTVYGGSYFYGMVYELTPETNGTWTETILHDFANNGVDGENPDSALLFDHAGNLYGETEGGGSGGGAGTVFKLTNVKTGGWIETVLHSFPAGNQDGAGPQGGLVSDAAGNLYGVTSGGGTYSGGTVFGIHP